MIKRPQSILLSIVIIGMIAVFKGPIWEKKHALSPHAICTMHAWNAKVSQFSTSNTPITDSSKELIYPYILIGILAVITACISFYALLKYNNRKLQLRLILLTIFIFIILISFIAYFAKGLNIKYAADLPGYFNTFKITALFIAYISDLAAFHLISKDEKLIKDDRIR